MRLILLKELSLVACAFGIVMSSRTTANQLPLNPELSNIYPTSQNLSAIIAASPLLTLHRALCEIESTSYHELTVGQFLVSFLEANNFTVTTQKVPQSSRSKYTGERLNILAVPDASKFQTNDRPLGETRAVKKVLLSSHIDTVPPFIPYSLSVPSSSSTGSFNRSSIVIAGRGTVDAKACVATQIQTVFELLSSSSHSISPESLALLFVVGEETIGDGMHHFSQSSLSSDLQSDGLAAVIFGEPTELKLATGHKGIFHFTMNAHGKAAHSGYPWLGRSAISIIIPPLAVVDNLGDIPEELGGLPRTDKYGKTTVNIGTIEAGIAGNVVPEHAVADVTMRLAGGTPAEVRKTVLKAIGAVANISDDVLEVSFSQGYGPVDMDGGVKGFDEITVNYGTDVPNLELRKGIKRYLYGPGSILVAHGDNEALTVGDLEEAVRGYKRLVLHALGTVY